MFENADKCYICILSVHQPPDSCFHCAPGRQFGLSQGPAGKHAPPFPLLPTSCQRWPGDKKNLPVPSPTPDGVAVTFHHPPWLMLMIYITRWSLWRNRSGWKRRSRPQEMEILAQVDLDWSMGSIQMFFVCFFCPDKGVCVWVLQSWIMQLRTDIYPWI